MHSQSFAQGIYILGNDLVLDQLMALVERLECNASQPRPICIIPYDENLKQTRQWIAEHGHLSLFENREAIAKWETFAQEVWTSHRVIDRMSQQYAKHYGQCHGARKFCAFEGPFEQFVFYDAHSLGMHSLDEVFEQLNLVDLIVDDQEPFQPEPIATLDLPYVMDVFNWSEAQLRGCLHGARFFAAKAGLIQDEDLMRLRWHLIGNGEARWMNSLRWWDDAALFSYMTLRLGLAPRQYSCLSRTSTECAADTVTSLRTIRFPSDLLNPGIIAF